LVNIIIISHDQLKLSQQCVTSLELTTKYPHKIIWIDNGSKDGTPKWVQQQGYIHHRYNKNMGFGLAVHKGMELAGEGHMGHVLWLNNDTILTPNWLENMVNLLESDKSIGAVGPLTNYAATRQKIVNHYEVNDKNYTKWVKGVKGGSEPTLLLSGFCLLLKDRAIQKVGLPDYINFPMSGEDFDYCFRLRENKYKLLIDKSTFIYHYGHVTANSQKTYSASHEWAKGATTLNRKWKKK